MKQKLFICTLIISCFLLCACSKNTQNPTILSEVAAQNIAIQEIPGAATSDIKVFRLENDNGIYIYEGTIIYEEQKYEFEIDATDGTILEWNMEPIYD